MASPFSFFRKHQAGMMVVLVILAMLVFTLDALFTQSGANFWLLGLLLGGAVFGVAGVGSGQWLQWGIGGGILGALLGLILPGFTGPLPVAAGSFLLERAEFDEMGQRRAIANRFLARATEEAFGEGTARFARQFGFRHSPAEDLMFGRLLTEEAKELQISVTDQMVSDYVNESTGDKLTAEGFAKARKALSYDQKPVTDEMLFDILKEQITREIAYKALAPQGSVSPPPPEVQWEYFKRMNVRQSINVTELDVDSFLDQVDEPSDAEIDELFATGRDKFPNQEEPGSPGFRLPGRARVTWLEADFDTVATTVDAVSNEDVDAFYNENRETRYRRVVIPDKESVDNKDEEPSTPAQEDTPEEQPAADAAPKEEAAKEESTSEPAEPTEEPEAKPESSEPSEPVTTESEETPAAPAETGGESPANRDSPAEGSEGEPEEPASAESSAGQFSVDDPEATENKEEEPGSEESSTASDEAQPAADNSAADQQPLIIPKKTEAEAAAEAGDMAVEYEYIELTDELRETIREELHTDRVREAINVKMDAAVSFMQAIASERRTKTSELIQKDPARYTEDPDAAAREIRAEMLKLLPGYLEQMQKYADENGLVFADTRTPVTFSEFSNVDDYPIGAATDPQRSQFQPGGRQDTAAFNIFSSIGSEVAANDTSLFMPNRGVYQPAVDEGSESQYAYWAVEFSESHIPTLDEPGVKESVIKEFKRIKARELVVARAEQLAQQVRDGLAKSGDERTGMAATLEDATITGKDGSATLTVRESLPFSWLRQSQTAAQRFQQRPQAELSRIRFADGVSMLEGVGNDFMEVIFDDMKDEDVSVVPNADLSSYFVLHVTKRFPTEELGMDGLRERFAREGQMNFAASPVMGLMSSDIVSPAVMEWERSLWRKHDLDPDIILAGIQQAGR